MRFSMNETIIDTGTPAAFLRPKTSSLKEPSGKESNFDSYVDRDRQEAPAPSSKDSSRTSGKKDPQDKSQSSSKQKKDDQSSDASTKQDNQDTTTAENLIDKSQSNRFVSNILETIFPTTAIDENAEEFALDPEILFDELGDNPEALENLEQIIPIEFITPETPLVNSNVIEDIQGIIPQTDNLLGEEAIIGTQDGIIAQELETLVEYPIDETLNNEEFATFIQDTTGNIAEAKGLKTSTETITDVINPANMDLEADALGGSLQNNLQNLTQTQNVQIQKATEAQILSQIPLDNKLTLNIVKDISNPNKIGINLEPAGMGEVELVIENNKENAVIAVLRSDKPEILDQLRKEAASLERYLTEAGLDLGGNGLSFEQKSSDDANTDAQSDSNNETLSATLAQEAVENSNAPQNRQEALYRTLDQQTADKGMDIRL